MVGPSGSPSTLFPFSASLPSLPPSFPPFLFSPSLLFSFPFPALFFPLFNPFPFPLPLSPPGMWRGPQVAPHNAVPAAQEQPRTLSGEWVFIPGGAIAGAPGDVPAEAGLDPGSGEGDEKKKRRGRKKSKLEDMFPPYLQVGWMGLLEVDEGDGWRGPPWC